MKLATEINIKVCFAYLRGSLSHPIVFAMTYEQLIAITRVQLIFSQFKSIVYIYHVITNVINNRSIKKLR